MEHNSDVNNNVDKQANQNLPENNDGSMITPENEMMSDDGEENNAIQEAEYREQNLQKEKVEVDLPYDVPNDETPPNADMPQKKTGESA